VGFCDGQKWGWGRFSPSTSVYPANLHSTNFSTITLTYHPGLVQQASSGCSTQSPIAQIKKNKKKNTLCKKRNYNSGFGIEGKVLRQCSNFAQNNFKALDNGRVGRNMLCGNIASKDIRPERI
jgi:hypothetical protein